MKELTRNLSHFLLATLVLAAAAIAAPAQEAAVGYGGSWETVNAKGRKMTMTLRHRRTAVGGRYESVDGLIKGTISGSVRDGVLRFTWMQSDGYKGAGRFTLARDGKSFKGTWSAAADPDDTSGGTWDGKRKP